MNRFHQSVAKVCRQRFSKRVDMGTQTFFYLWLVSKLHHGLRMLLKRIVARYEALNLKYPIAVRGGGGTHSAAHNLFKTVGFRIVALSVL